MARILFVHNTFPGRFNFLLPSLKERGHSCAAIASGGRDTPGIPLLRWKTTRGSTKGIFEVATRAEADFIRGRAAAECALRLRKDGFIPDLVIGHPGWGETTYIKEIFPNAKQILQGEFYYRSSGGDVGFDPEFGTVTDEERFRIHSKNAGMALALADCDHIVFPTEYQASVFPPAFRARGSVIHEGIDASRTKPVANASFKLPDGRVLDATTPVVTFINRRFEPLRGFHIMMRALPAIQAQSPNVHVLMIGADETGGYGLPAPKGKTWKQVFLDEVGGKLDHARIHWTGTVPYDALLNMLTLSCAHIYYTYPFVLSWSLCDAMACECLLLASDTPPLHDAIEDGVNGRLIGFFDIDGLSNAIVEAVREPDRFTALRRNARQTVLEKFDQMRSCLPAWLELIDHLLPRSAGK